MNGAPDWEGETRFYLPNEDAERRPLTPSCSSAQTSFCHGLGDARSRYDPIPSLGRAD